MSCLPLSRIAKCAGREWVVAGIDVRAWATASSLSLGAMNLEPAADSSRALYHLFSPLSLSTQQGGAEIHRARPDRPDIAEARGAAGAVLDAEARAPGPAPQEDARHPPPLDEGADQQEDAPPDEEGQGFPDAQVCGQGINVRIVFSSAVGMFFFAVMACCCEGELAYRVKRLSVVVLEFCLR